MQVLHFAVVFCLLALAVSKSVDDRQAEPPVSEGEEPTQSAANPTILQNLEKRPWFRWVPLVSRFLDLLNDSDVSEKFYDLIKNRNEILNKAWTCVDKNTVAFLNNKTTVLGQALNAWRWGAPINRLTDFLSLNFLAGNVFTLIPTIMNMVPNINKLVNEVSEDLIPKLSADCLNGDLKEYRQDVDYIMDAFQTKVLQNTE